jgi:general secretion pathway protein I
MTPRRLSKVSKRARAARCEGFTLIEALVALVIVSLGMMAVNMQLNQYAVTAIYVEEKTLASWIATNVLTELSVQPDWPELGDIEDDLEFANREWHYRIEVSETQVPNLRRADVRVSAAETPEQVLHTVSGLIEPPAPRGFVPTRWFTSGGEAG